VFHGMALLLHHDGPSNLAAISINRSSKEGFYTSSDHRRALTLLPHLRNAYLLQQRLGWMETEARAFRCALDRLNDGVVLLDLRCKIRFTNTRAEHMASMGMFRRRPDGGIALPNVLQSRQLEAFLSIADSRPDILSLQLTDGAGVATGMLRACPVQAVAHPHWGESDWAVILFFTSPHTEIVGGQSVRWKERWGFTRAETTLALHLAAGCSLTETAEMMGVTRNTVRTQLRALFMKTGARRQSDLVRMLVLEPR